jgi:ATP-dependent exoDNAse (exonuclease V) beta subunit
MSEFRWTAEQARAIQSLGQTMLSASAGTGKTTTVIGKILWHLGLDVGVNRDTGEPVPPCPEAQRATLWRIAAITFTEKAAYDLKKKLRAEIEEHAPHLMWDIDRASIGTIHSFCGDLLREHALRLEIDPTFRVLDEREARLEQDEIVKEVLLEALAGGDEGAIDLVERYRLAGYEHTKGAEDYVCELLKDVRWHGARYDEWSREGLLDIERLRDVSPGWSDLDDAPAELCATAFRLACRAMSAWERFERDENVRDFDSLILDTRALLTAGSPALESIRRRLSLLIIDEFQDTDQAQRDIALAIAGDRGGEGRKGETPPQLFIVGDPKQSVYGFRGADIAVWNQVKAALCGDAEPLQLTYNFRSDPQVVDFVNRVCEPAVNRAAAALTDESPESRVEYAPLHADRSASAVAQVEWMVADGRADERREAEAEMVAARIRDIVIDESRGDFDGIRIRDPDTGEERDCLYRDVAILFRTRRGLEHYEPALQHYGVPYYLAGDAGLTRRQEILDLLNVLRLLENPRDDLCAFGYLRSPFVGLRDEIIARLRLDSRGHTLLERARHFLKHGDWFPAPEHEEVAAIEKDALATGLESVDRLSALRSRIPIDELLEEVLDATGYRLHLLLMDQPEPKLANIQRFIRLVQGYRHHTVGTFLEIWERWESQDLGIPQAPLYSKRDDVVTLSTIHSAKGLEWPIVFLVDTEGSGSDRPANEFWSDRVLGPVICPRQAERGLRTVLLQQRRSLEHTAEEARLLYVASTRARERLVVTGPRRRPKGVAEWLSRGVNDSVVVTEATPEVEIPPLPPEPELAWLGDIREGDMRDALVAPLPRPATRHTRSATEIMTRRRNFEEWKLKYRHGVVPCWYFTRDAVADGGVPASVRGQVIHGVLELIEEEEELAELLEVTIGALDSPELEQRMAPGTAYRLSLEDEIKRVIAGDEWKWYVEGEHYRELPFVQLRNAGRWRVGAFDLFRPAGGADGGNLIVDFKTHSINADQAAATARSYQSQGAFYKAVAGALAGETRVQLHFTHPNVVCDLE